MIFVRRLPLDKRSTLAKQLASLTRDVLGQQGKQSRIEFLPLPNEIFRELSLMFLLKCAYCESRLGASDRPDRFRPKQNAKETDNRSDPDHYFWLAYRWDNIVSACTDCNMAKGTLFPLMAPKRAPIGATGKALQPERPLLLDPCLDRHPERHLRFDELGGVEPLSNRGSMTIDVLNLSRYALVERRRIQIQQARAAFDARNHNALAALTARDAPYSGAINQCLTRWERKKQPVNIRRAPVKAVRPPTAIRPGTLRKIHVHNFRTLHNVSLTLPKHNDGTTPWLVLLGENGGGKTSLLQAVSLALLGKESIAEIGQDTLDDAISNGKNDAHIKLTFEDPPRLVELRLRRGREPRFAHGGEGYNAVVAGYGASRLTARDRKLPVMPDDQAARRVQNLFDPWVGLADPDLWLTKLNKNEFDYAARTLKDLLHLTHKRGDIFQVKKGAIVVTLGHSTLKIRQLSAGYQSIVALGTDLMSAMPRGILDKQAATGIVLIDEIDAHLHPRWKREVVKTLRMCFPQMQFLVSTHEPLCLVGVREKETVLMRRNEETHEVEIDANLPSPEGLRVDQLLTSRHFGLHTTIDPELDAKFREYYRLLSISERALTAKQKKDLATLKGQLENVGVLGYTRRDQLVYELIDRFIAEESRLSVKERKPLEKKLKKEVLEIWQHVKTTTRESS